MSTRDEDWGDAVVISWAGLKSYGGHISDVAGGGPPRIVTSGSGKYRRPQLAICHPLAIRHDLEVPVTILRRDVEDFRRLIVGSWGDSEPAWSRVGLTSGGSLVAVAVPYEQWGDEREWPRYRGYERIRQSVARTQERASAAHAHRRSIERPAPRTGIEVPGLA